MNYAAFDLGTRCGVARMGETGVAARLINLTKDGKFGPFAFSEFRAVVSDYIREADIDHIFIEKPHAGNYFHAVRILFGLMGVLEEVCQSYDVTYEYYSPATVKKFWCGTGRASKAQMVAKTQERYPTVKDHNVSDAIALLEYGMSQEID